MCYRNEPIHLSTYICGRIAPVMHHRRPHKLQFRLAAVGDQCQQRPSPPMHFRHRCQQRHRLASFSIPCTSRCLVSLAHQQSPAHPSRWSPAEGACLFQRATAPVSVGLHWCANCSSKISSHLLHGGLERAHRLPKRCRLSCAKGLDTTRRPQDSRRVKTALNQADMNKPSQ